MGKSVTLVDGDGVGDAVAGVQHDTGGTAGGVEGEHGLDGDVHGGRVEGLEHDLGHLLAVSLGVEGSLGQQNGMFLRGDTQLVVKGVMPDLLHVVPVGDDLASPTGTTWRRSGITPFTTSCVSPLRNIPFC